MDTQQHTTRGGPRTAKPQDTPNNDNKNTCPTTHIDSPIMKRNSGSNNRRKSGGGRAKSPPRSPPPPGSGGNSGCWPTDAADRLTQAATATTTPFAASSSFTTSSNNNRNSNNNNNNNNKDDNNNDNQRNSNRNNTFLSKNSLYTPLSAYDQTKVEPSLYLGTKSSIPNSLHETSLVNFLRTVSLDYYYQQSDIYDSTSSTTKTTTTTTAASLKHSPPPYYIHHKNDCKYVGGSQAVPLSKIEERIRQRTVTLLGGGIHVTAAKQKATAMKLARIQQPNKNHGGLGRRRRRRRRQRRIQHQKGRIESSPPSQRKILDNNNTINNMNHDIRDAHHHPAPHEYQLHFVRQLNTTWNEYMIQALRVISMGKETSPPIKTTKIRREEEKEKEKEDGPLLPSRMVEQHHVHQLFSMMEEESSSSTLSSTTMMTQKNHPVSLLELVGAHIHIISCAQRKSLVDQKGVVVGQSKNCWMVAMLLQQQQQPRQQKRKRSQQQPYNTISIKDKKKEKEIDNLIIDEQDNSNIQNTKQQFISPSEEAETEEEKLQRWTVQSVMIPKRGTSITLLLRIPSSSVASNATTTTTVSEKEDVNNTDETSTTMDLIPRLLPASSFQTLCVVVSPQNSSE